MKQIKTLVAFVAVVAFSAMALAQVAPATQTLKMTGVVKTVDAKTMTFSLPILDENGKATDKTTTFTYNDATKFTWGTQDMKTATAADLKAGSTVSGTYSASKTGNNLALTVVIKPTV